MIWYAVVHSSGKNKESYKKSSCPRYIQNWKSKSSEYFSCTKVFSVLYMRVCVIL